MVGPMHPNNSASDVGRPTIAPEYQRPAYYFAEPLSFKLIAVFLLGLSIQSFVRAVVC